MRSPEPGEPIGHPCTACRHAKPTGWWSLTFGDPNNWQCRHPTVHGKVHLAHAQGMMLPDTTGGTPVIRPADPVTGALEQRFVTCGLARSRAWRHRDNPSPQPEFLCLPEGRYFQRGIQ